jgi:hypothetical protein
MKVSINIWRVVSLIFLLALGGCTKNDAIQLKTEKPERVIDISNQLVLGKVTRFVKDTVYVIKGTSVTVSKGQQLIIDAGTLIKLYVASSKPEIIVEPGGILIANGTKAEPIVFTSNAVKGSQLPGDWKGITIKGDMPNNAEPGNSNGTDFSGSLNYVRIEFAGLTLKSAGAATVIENVQVSYAAGQAAFKFEGGTVNARNLFSYAAAAGADFYITNGYTGNMQNIAALRHPFFATSSLQQSSLLTGILIENSETGNSTAVPQTNPALSNITIMGPDAEPGRLKIYNDNSFANAALVTTGNARFNIRNSVFAGFNAAGWYLNDRSTAMALQTQQKAICANSFIQCSDAARPFYLVPGVYDTFTSFSFRIFMLNPVLKNQALLTTGQLRLTAPFNYSNPGLQPGSGSPLLTGADYNGQVFTRPFFIQHPYIGAFGNSNWIENWTNFNPLQTDYNQLR